jgi:hypothetical protein
MANLAKPNEEARKDAEAFFRGDSLRTEVFLSRQGRPTPRVREKKTLRKIAAESRALTERARTNKLRSDDLGGGTFTVSNLGMFDVDEFIAIINPSVNSRSEPQSKESAA